MSEYTPGPWIQEAAMSSAKHIRDILQAGGNIVLAMVGGEIQSEALANARLIAAAPELLEACEDALKKLEWPICTNNDILSMKDCRVRLKAIIAKATP